MVNPYAQSSAGPYAPGQYPATGAYPAYPQGQDPNYHGLIPYKNAFALLAYYTGIFGMFPCVPVLGIAALIFGIIGLRNYNRDPSIKGVVHALIGIVLGGGATLLYGAATILWIYVVTDGGRR
jgi:hypothetical protein